MVKSKTQKVRFHKGDKRPGGQLESKLAYTVEMIKEGRKYILKSWNIYSLIFTTIDYENI